MAGKPKAMSQIKQLIRLSLQGAGKKHIARTLGVSRTTVKAYLDKIALDGIPAEELLALDDPVLLARLHAGDPAYKDSRFGVLADRFDYFVKELTKVGVTRKLLWEEYRERHPQGYGYSQRSEEHTSELQS